MPNNLFVYTLGPQLPIEDDEVHVWTAVIDELLSNGKTLMTVAVGNDGEKDIDAGNARIQPPSDAVNVLSVGSCDILDKDWRRAEYSCIGPGRSPGIIKPDILAFGGTYNNPFYVLSDTNINIARPASGTSFASPFALRIAIGIKYFLYDYIDPLTLKALLIHMADKNGLPQREVGWGRITDNIEDLITCNDNEATIVYQGELIAGQYTKAEIPFPNIDNLNMKGNINLKATFCYSTEVDQQDPINYTRAGLEITFRPNSNKYKNPGQKSPNSRSFFKPADMKIDEYTLRDQFHKWENVLKCEDTLRIKSLSKPYLDIHYNARSKGYNDENASPIPYALIISIKADNINNFYNLMVQKYRTILEIMAPIEIQIPVKS